MNTIASQVRSVGVTALWTRRQQLSRNLAGVLALLGAVVSTTMGAAVLAVISGADQVWLSIGFRPPLTGPLFAATNPGHLQFPVTITVPDVTWWLAALVGLPLFLVWLRYLVRPLMGWDGNARHKGLAAVKDIRKTYGPHAVRKSWKYAFPTSTAAQRFLIGTNAMGIHLGEALAPAKGGKLWVNLEQRVRIIAAPGWGKTTRLLIPIIRQLHGPVLISSTEPEIFTSTVLARTHRRLPGRLGYRHPVHTYPVAVVDCSPNNRITGGKYETVKWNPIPGCEDFSTATRRAEALMKGVDNSGQTQDNGAAKYFEEVASAVVAAMFHAAALAGDVDLDHIGDWISRSTYVRPDTVLQKYGEGLVVTVNSEPVALMGIRKFLDKAGGRTTVQVEASVLKAVASMLSLEGRAICGQRSEPQFDLTELIRAQGTLYLLGEPDRMRVVRPLLSMIAAEVFVAAEDVARTSGGTHPAFYAVLDELRSGVRISTLPDVASEKRKYRIGYLYACTNGGDEAALYGEADAARLKAAAGVSIYGGFDEQSVDDITGRAGETNVVQASRGGIAGTRQESVQQFDVLTKADMQQLQDGESVIVGRTMLPFLAVSEGVHETRSLRRQIKRETAVTA